MNFLKFLSWRIFLYVFKWVFFSFSIIWSRIRCRSSFFELKWRPILQQNQLEFTFSLNYLRLYPTDPSESALFSSWASLFQKTAPYFSNFFFNFSNFSFTNKKNPKKNTKSIKFNLKKIWILKFGAKKLKKSGLVSEASVMI